MATAACRNTGALRNLSRCEEAFGAGGQPKVILHLKIGLERNKRAEMRAKLFLAIAATIVTHSAAAGIFGNIIGGVAGHAAGNVAGKAAGQTLTQPSAADIDAMLAKAVTLINRSAPQHLDAQTDLVGASSGPGPRLNYKYTLVNYKAAEVDRSVLGDRFNQQIKPGICASADLAKVFRFGVSIGFDYRGRDGGPVFSRVLSPQDCGYKV